MFYILHLCASNDPNGNPRRLYLVRSNDGSTAYAYDEGYMGAGAVPKRFRRLAFSAFRLNVTVSEYRRILRSHGVSS